jgi:V8-like Glu-specific endopeptidase
MRLTHFRKPIYLAIAGVIFLTLPAGGAIFDRLGRKLPDREVNSERVDWQLVRSKTGANYNGIGLVRLMNGTCTGFLIEPSDRGDAPAYVVTNAHCQGGWDNLPGAKEIIIDRAVKINFVVNYFHDFDRGRWSIPVKRIVYATMKNNDIALLELKATQEDIRKAGLQTLKLSPTPPHKGEPLKVVGIPADGVDAERNFLHQTSCQMGNTVRLKEDVYTWYQALRHRCSIVGGMSGSPMISTKTNRVVGIVNTGVNDGALRQPQCSLNRPCEFNSQGVRQTFPSENYGQPVYQLAGCFNRAGMFDIDRETCQLEKP